MFIKIYAYFWSNNVSQDYQIGIGNELKHTKTNLINLTGATHLWYLIDTVRIKIIIEEKAKVLPLKRDFLPIFKE